MRIGVISDTHNYLDPEVLRLLQGVDHILHGGDIGSPRILFELEQVAPLTAVGGNTDDHAFRYSDFEVIELSGKKFLLHHIVDPTALTESLRARIARVRPHVVVFGHTHKPFCQTVDGILYFNPGAAGKQRFKLPRSVGLIHCTPSGLRPELLTLPNPS